jgi:bifunctional ADP-heptose synthase (sugar kinase/adenylyltransferase)
MEDNLFSEYLNLKIVKKKLISIDEVKKLSKRDNILRVLNVGSYDIIHPGHCSTLYFSKNINELIELFPESYGSFGIEEIMKNEGKINLLVALNSDESFKQLDNECRKSGKRKIQTHNQNERIWQLANNENVDNIVLFDDKNELSIIKAYMPHIFIKGGDYTLDSNESNNKSKLNIDIKNAIDDVGGKILLMPLIGFEDEVYHSYSFVKRVLEKHG